MVLGWNLKSHFPVPHTGTGNPAPDTTGILTNAPGFRTPEPLLPAEVGANTTLNLHDLPGVRVRLTVQVSLEP
jgi:hypothetical protein